MVLEEDEIYLKDKDYCLPLEKYCNPFIYQKLNSGNGTISQVYGFSNERLDAIFTHFNFKDKRVLTVGSSGDQAINAISRGAKDVTIIDANIFTKAYTEYKISAIKNLSYEEFRKAFLEEQNPFDWRIYAKISHDLSDSSKIIWDNIILNQDNSLETYENLVHQEKWKTKTTSRFYKSEKEYNMVAKKLNTCNIQYIYSEFTKFPSYANGKYDVILFSNIFAYFCKDVKAFRKVVDDFYDNHLNLGGKIQIHYQFDNRSKYATNVFNHLFPDKKINYALIGNHFAYYISKPIKQTQINNSANQNNQRERV